MEILRDYGVFDIMGPIMLGPSSSHTGGAIRIGLIAGQLCNYNPKEIEILFHGAIACTYSTHKTDAGIIGGILGIKIDDERIRESLTIAKSKGIKVSFKEIHLQNAYPNTAIIKIIDQNDKKIEIRGCTIGGGNIVVEEINGYRFNLDGKSNYILGVVKGIDEEEFNKKIEIAFNYKPDNIDIYQENGNLVFKIKNITKIEDDILNRISNIPGIIELHSISAVMPIKVNNKRFYNCINELVEVSKRNNCSISDTVIQYEVKSSNRSEKEVFEEMENIYQVMKESIARGLEKEHKLLGNTFNGNAAKMNKFMKSGKSLCGGDATKVVRDALAVMEVNGSMGKVATCPTAGSCGTVPAAVITIAESKGISKDKIVKSLFTGAGIGVIIANKVSISGGIGGCQAEIGSASAMAAASITELFGGNYSEICSAVSLSLGNLLGLVCDPAAGMVEIPCIQRNTVAAMNAIISAEMALAGVDSVIPADEMIQAMEEVGRLMPTSLKATLRAGISNTPTARKLEEKLFKKDKTLNIDDNYK